jgi:hypothetical protein
MDLRGDVLGCYSSKTGAIKSSRECKSKCVLLRFDKIRILQRWHATVSSLWLPKSRYRVTVPFQTFQDKVTYLFSSNLGGIKETCQPTSSINLYLDPLFSIVILRVHLGLPETVYFQPFIYIIITISFRYSDRKNSSRVDYTL